MSNTDPKHHTLIAGLIAERVLKPSEKNFALDVIRTHGMGVFDAFVSERKKQLATLQADIGLCRDTCKIGHETECPRCVIDMA